MARSDEFFRYLLIQVGYHAPTTITFLVGLVISAIYWSRRPRQSMLVLLSSIIALVNSVGYSIIFAYVVSRRSNYSARQSTLAALAVITSTVAVLPYVLLFIAALSGRSQQAAFPVDATAVRESIVVEATVRTLHN